MKYKVDKDNVEVRLDRFLKKSCKNNGLSEIFSAIRKGEIRINGKKSKENYRLKLNDEIEIQDLDFKIKENKKINYEYKNLIFYENDDILIINKPKGMAMHKGTDTKKGIAEMFNMDFANRLDKKTSGLVIGCKNPVSLRHITKLIRENMIIKKYKAICLDNGKYNIGDEFIIENKLLETDEKVIVSKNGKESKTKFKVIDKKDKKIYFDIELFTGRKHQIRVHLSSIGLPIIGDDKYSSKYKKADKLELECYYLEFDNKKYEIK
ncbi:pseudouridine synthase [Oceanivirga salmonicida]|uniref:pseudouridine synthase n=1 Tax=Oceanivirga salmonicida TaxID=1769291 RepID=UPI00083793D5|nr:RluA family pseudouridine synthase [Oceanivirga salmonicida]